MTVGNGAGAAWPALVAARRTSVARVPFLIGTERAGSVARQHLAALRGLAAPLQIDANAVTLAPALHDVGQRSAALAAVNVALRDAGVITAWRDETYAVWDSAGRRPMALIERAAARFWGTLTFGAHANGYVADAAGRPTRLWIARRALTKATDPGLLDNLIGGGVPYGQTPIEALVREGFEEAGLAPAVVAAATPGRVIEVACDIAQGYMHERLHVFDLPLPADACPVNQDGEVAELTLLPVAQALALAASGTMTVDAELVTLDFALRHRLLPSDEHARCTAEMSRLLAAR